MTKTSCAVLVAVLIVHLLCSGSCASEAFAGSAAPPTPEPPCHGHEQKPSPSAPQSHEGGGPCSQGQIVASKPGAIGTCVLQLDAAVLLPAISSSLTLPVVLRDLMPERSPGIAGVAGTIFNFRI
jgi:hypothetical protein